MNLTLAAIRRPVWVIMAMAAAMIMGYRGCTRMPVEENPEVSFPFVTVRTAYFGAGSDEIEELISKRIEDAVTTAEGIKTITSNSLEGVSIVTIEFALSVNDDAALADVKSKVDDIRALLPPEAEDPVVSKLNLAGDPILYLAADSEELTALELRDTLDNRIVDRLARVPGVAQVGVSGGDIRELRVAIHRDRLISYGLGMVNALDAIRGANLDVAGGSISSGSKETSVRVAGEFASVAELEILVIPVSDQQNPNTPPAIVRLKDIATISDGPAKVTEFTRVNGNPAVLLTVSKTREGNTVAITETIKHELEKVSEEYPISFTTTRESAKQVHESLEDLKIALALGVVLVIGIIYLFLHNFRGTMIVALAIPTCLLAAFAVIDALGFTLNTMTMLGLSLAVGILVDDAIVVLENTYRHLTHGEDPETAALNGRAEIGLAAISITMVDVVVFLPVAVMGGILGQFFRPFALTVAVATLFSLFVSFTLTPMLASRWYRKGERLEDKRGFAKWFDTSFGKLANGYRNALAKALHRRWLVFMAGWAFLFGVFMAIGGGMAPTVSEAVAGGMGMGMFAIVVAGACFIISLLRRKANVRILLGGAAFAVTMVVASVIGFGLGQYKGGPLLNTRFAPSAESGQITIDVTMPPGSSLDRTLAAVERVERVGMELPEADYVVSRVGFQQTGFGQNAGSQYGQVLVTLKDKRALMDTIQFWKPPQEDLRVRTQEELVTVLQQQIGKVPDATITVSGQTGFVGGPPVQVAVLSIDKDKVTPAADKVIAALSEIKGIVSIDLASKPGKPEIVVRPDRVALADNDMSVQQLGAVARVAYEGNTDSKYREAGREYNIRVNFADDVRENPSLIGSVPVKFRNGNPVFLDQVAELGSGSATDKIERRDRQRQLTVTAYLLPGFVIGTVGAEIEAKLTGLDLGAGVSYKQLGENEIMANEMPYMNAAFMLGLILVFLVLASLFNNILYPFVVQLAQPQALVGALIALMITDKPTELVVMIGILMLIGLVGKNAILMVDYTNTLRARGMSRHDALVEAGPTRLRPIIMTTLAMILAMIPVAVSLGRGSEFRSSLGVVIIGGLTLSTLLTLFVIPASYSIFDDLSLGIGKLVQRLTSRIGKQAASVEGESR
jgi:HAE1 family hydrophobic/amphiphilic exporter-1